MPYTLEINTRLTELKKIFAENHQGFLTKESAQAFDKLVCVLDDRAVGYLGVYNRPDFMKQEGYPVKFSPQESCIYIWTVVTSKEQQGKGVATFLLENAKARFMDKTLYAVVHIDNVRSIKVFERAGFKCILSFQATQGGSGTHCLYAYKS